MSRLDLSALIKSRVRLFVISLILVDLAAPFLRQWIKYRNVSRLSRLFGKLYDRWMFRCSAERNGARLLRA